MKPRDPIEWEETLPGIRPSSPAWRAATIAIWGARPLSPEDERMFLRLSGGRPPPVGGHDDVQVTAGRRSFKTGWAARCCYYEARHGGHEVAAEPGQVLIAGVAAPLREQASECIRYVHGLASQPSERRHVKRITADGVEFKNGVAIRVVTFDEVAVAGTTWCMAVIEEAARLPGPDAATPDRAIFESLLPALAPVRGAPRRKIIRITSAYLQVGMAYETDRDCFGRHDAPILALRGSTLDFNPNIDPAWLAKQKSRPEYAREYETQWQASLVSGALDAGRVEYAQRDPPPRFDRMERVVCLDPASLRGRDRFTCCVAGISVPDPEFGRILTRNVYDESGTLTMRDVAVHDEHGNQVQDPNWVRPRPFLHIECVGALDDAVTNPTSTDFADIIASVARSWDARHVWSDQRESLSLGALLRERGLVFHEHPYTNATKAECVERLRRHLADGTIVLPKHERLRAELVNFSEFLTTTSVRYAARGSGTDDYVSAVLMAIRAELDQGLPGSILGRRNGVIEYDPYTDAA